MPSCEICGAEGISTRTISVHGAMVQSCKQCQVKMGHNIETDTSVQNVQQAANRSSKVTSGGYGGLGTAGKDIMVRDSKELISDFSTLIRNSRESRGWDQRTLAHRMKEKINIIQRTEAGQRPADELIKKFERTLDITLLIDATDIPVDQIVGNKNARTLSLGDYIKMAREEGD
ncbi:MAG TPA: TIGR00270 family protein [Candidatus Poseidoniales archaeon]|nr:MAG TPA: TIGR00270 family protein [Candidatus Poseidoniales archaeon]